MTRGKNATISRDRVVTVFLVQGLIGLGLALGVTFTRSEETAAHLASLGSSALPLVVTFFLTCCALQMLRFELARDIHVALSLTGCIAMFPLLGLVPSVWIAVAGPMLARLLSLRKIGPTKIEVDDWPAELVRTFGLFATYGVPVVVATLLYEVIGGRFGSALGPTFGDAWRIALCGVVLVLANSLVMVRPGLAYGLRPRRILVLYSIDFSIYLLTLPYSVVMALAFSSLGWMAVAALAIELIIAFAVTRTMALAQRASGNLLQRLASLMNIGKAISLTTTDNLLLTLYTECQKVIDVSLFSIAILDEKSGELSLELLIQNDEILPRRRIPPGEGLNAWVAAHHEPLLLGSTEEESRLGLRAVDDGMLQTQSWLGVPMITRDRVVGVISVQSFRRNAFTSDDILLLTSVANQAAVALDNTKLYEELEDLTYALEERVQERTNELHEINRQLVAADKTKNDFLAKMSHELRTPLNSIIGFSSVLLQNTREELPPRLYKFLENIQTAGQHLLSLINDILDLSKIEAGKVELRLEKFDPRETVASVERVMRGFAAEARVTIRALVSPDVPKVVLDEGRLKQIFFNLLSNAVKYSPEYSSVEIELTKVARKESPLKVESLRVDVRDRGAGIPAPEVSRIFDEFYQAGRDRDPRKSGTGLGLSLTRNFVELHHGTIEVKSSPGAGSTFTMFLPIDCRENDEGSYPFVPRRRVPA